MFLAADSLAFITVDVVVVIASPESFKAQTKKIEKERERERNKDRNSLTRRQLKSELRWEPTSVERRQEGTDGIL